MQKKIPPTPFCKGGGLQKIPPILPFPKGGTFCALVYGHGETVFDSTLSFSKGGTFCMRIKKIPPFGKGGRGGIFLCAIHFMKAQ